MYACMSTIMTVIALGSLIELILIVTEHQLRTHFGKLRATSTVQLLKCYLRRDPSISPLLPRYQEAFIEVEDKNDQLALLSCLTKYVSPLLSC
jgi:hypothetical protein